jgi:ParB family chromosome partitioning protein
LHHRENENTIIQEIPLHRIRPSAANPRQGMDSAALAELAESIKLHGVLQPIHVRPMADGNFEIVCGERRYRAAKSAGKVTIPARVMNLSNAEALETATIENLLRENLHELEEAESYARLLAMNPKFTPAIVAEHVGKSVSHVHRRR